MFILQQFKTYCYICKIATHKFDVKFQARKIDTVTINNIKNQNKRLPIESLALNIFKIKHSQNNQR